ncbi:MAG: transcriptional regulator, partial [Okeania sp. SIO2H7]|nr:transcriptional regulator [Okeania sp. SIO2H7]
DNKIWEAFGDSVGWKQGEDWLSYQDLRWNKNCGATPFGHLPYPIVKTFELCIYFFSRKDL